MAASKVKKVTKKVSFTYLKKLTAGVSLLCLMVIVLAGVIGQARVITITYRAAIAILVIGVVSRVVIKILLSYEDMHGGKA